MRRPSRSRRTVKLSDSVQRHLNMYALAAGAAGVGMLALAQPAEARIVYTPANKHIAPNQTLPLDLNHDGINDFSFQDPYSFDGNSGGGTLKLAPAKAGNRAWVSGGYAAALAAGVRVGPARPFAPGTKPMARVFVTPSSTPNTRGYGPWQKATKRYLGLKFLISGKIHFGWARLTVKAQAGGVVATLTGYAYETVPNKPIVTGRTEGPDEDRSLGQANVSFGTSGRESASLGMLAQGSPSLSIWRGEDLAGPRPSN